MADALQNYIDGAWADAADGGRLDIHNPATGEVVATTPDSQPEDARRAVEAARRTFDEGAWWPGATPRERGRILLRAAEIVERELERFARMEAIDSGKPIEEARGDIEDVAYMFEYYGGWATKVHGDVPPVGPEGLSFVLKEPVGVAVGITPWNYPMLMAAQKLAPALAAGCTFVLKPPEQTPLTCLELPRVLEEAGLPPGVFNVITGYGETAGAPLVSSPAVDKIGFTGSKEVGQLITRTGADTLKRVTLELGGKSPNIVFADSDVDAAIEGSCNGVFWNQGEICSAGSRVFVERAIYDDALSAMVEHAKQVKLGDQLDESTTMGPLVSREQQERVERYIEIGMDEARLAIQGDPPSDPRLEGGYWVPPTIFADASNDVTIAREEIFGPVMTVIPFGDVEEVIRLANDNEYGLAAAIWTKDNTKALTTARALRTGVVWINSTQTTPIEAPWGGYKHSGVGRELGKDGIEDYLETKHLYVNLA